MAMSYKIKLNFETQKITESTNKCCLGGKFINTQVKNLITISLIVKPTLLHYKYKYRFLLLDTLFLSTVDNFSFVDSVLNNAFLKTSKLNI